MIDWGRTITFDQNVISVIIKWNAMTQICVNDIVVYKGITWLGFKKVDIDYIPGITEIKIWRIPLLKISINSNGIQHKISFWKDTTIWAIKCGSAGFVIGLIIASALLYFLLKYDY